MGVEALRRSRTALLTSYRRNGQQVATPVSISLAGGRAYFVTAVDSGKARRLAHDPRVLLAPCTVGGERLGADVPGRARRLQGGARRARPMLLRPTGPLFWSWLLYRLRGKTMALYEVEFDGPGEHRRTALSLARRDRGTAGRASWSPHTHGVRAEPVGVEVHAEVVEVGVRMGLPSWNHSR
jgi:uncharacterized protein